MIKTTIHPVGILIALAMAPCAAGHGTPIHIEVSENRLIVSGGLTDTEGFAPMVFAEDDDDGEPESFTLPLLGPVVLWELPGVEIFGMNDESNLSIEVLARPVKDSNPIEERIIWYWNPQTELVEPSPAALHLLGTGQRFTTLSPASSMAPPPFLLADPIAEHQGFHDHSLLAYALDDDLPAVAGVYGFFARFVSNMHEASDPFLLAFDHGVDFNQVFSAALAINASAADPDVGPIPGDYDSDGQVTTGDYDFWKLHFGDTVVPFALADGNGDGTIDAADYTVWRDALSRSPSGVGAGAVPEPATAVLALFCGVIVVLSYRARSPIFFPAHGWELSSAPRFRPSSRLN